LGLAVARAVATVAGHADEDVAALARRAGRGERSALGIHGFAHGGFLVEAGQRTPEVLPPLVARLAFPEEWRVLLILPPGGPGLHGQLEKQAFARLTSPSAAWTDALCRLVLLGMLPALLERDLATFGEAVHDFNARVGEVFAPVQGGTYADPRVSDVVRFVRAQGAPGVGQSSWGLATYAIVADEDRGNDLVRRVRREFNLSIGEAILTRGRNRGAATI
jgi:beta-RFAP synthase